jgi:hypothetical protein
VVGTLVTGCGSSGKSNASSSPKASPPASVAASLAATDVQAITKNWEAFFSKDTPVAQKVALLQNGQAMAPAVAAFAKDPRMGQTTAKVTSVLGSGTNATVHYQILVSGQTMLPDAVGQAVNEGGTWKVGDQTLCGLLALAAPGGTKIPGCS